MKIKLYVIQYEHGGIPEEPDIFIDRRVAEQFYLKFFNQEFKCAFSKVDEAYEWMMGDSHDGDNMLRWWSLDLNIPPTSNKVLHLYRDASRLLLSAYRKGAQNGSSMDWEDVDQAWEVAKQAESLERKEAKKK